MTTTDNNSINNIKTLNLKDNQNVLFIPQEDKISNNQDIIKNLEVDNTNDKINISSLTQGVYFVKYENGFKKFIVKQD